MSRFEPKRKYLVSLLVIRYICLFGEKSNKFFVSRNLSLASIYFFIRHSCYLVTFYFIRQLLTLPGLTSTEEGKRPSIDSWVESPTTPSTANTSPATPEEEKVIDFINSYGAYLKLHTCLVRASDVGSGPILRTLLDMARFDLRHRDCLKRLSNKQTTFFLYESVSACSHAEC